MAVLKELILTVSTLGRCGSLEKIEFNSFYLQGCGGLERTDLTVSTFEGVACLETTDFNSFYFGRVWQS